MEIFFIQRAVLGRLGDLLFGDGFLSFEVGDGSGNLEDAVVAARGKRELIEDGMEELVGRRRKSAIWILIFTIVRPPAPTLSLYGFPDGYIFSR